MDVLTRAHKQPTPERVARIESASGHGWLGIALFTLAVGLITNSLLGPMVADAIDYPWSESMRNQAIGLEAVSMFVVAPLCILAGVLAIRGHLSAPLVAFGPAAYTAYMFLQYVIGPEYHSYPAVLPLHLACSSSGWGSPSPRGRRGIESACRRWLDVRSGGTGLSCSCWQHSSSPDTCRRSSPGRANRSPPSS